MGWRGQGKEGRRGGEDRRERGEEGEWRVGDDGERGR